MKKLLVRVVVGLLVLMACVYGVGLTMPRDHLVSSRIQLTAPRDSVWAVLRAFGDYPKWDTDFKSSVRGKARNGHEVWVQDVGGMTMSIEVKDVQPPARLVRGGLPFRAAECPGDVPRPLHSTRRPAPRASGRA